MWNTLRAVKSEFINFGEMLDKAQKQMQTADKTLTEIVGRRTRTINRTLRGVEELAETNDSGSPNKIIFEGKTYVKVWDEELEEWVYLPEEEVPLSGQEVPQTGDESKLWLWGLLSLAALAGLAFVLLKKPGQKQD